MERAEEEEEEEEEQLRGGMDEGEDESGVNLSYITTLTTSVLHVSRI